MTDFIERFDLEDEFDKALACARNSVAFSINGDSDESIGEAGKAYIHLRFIQENLGRYRFALGFINEDDKVIDAPCGEGYGSVILASSGQLTIGVDINEEVIARAKDKYRYENLYFNTGDITKPLPHCNLLVCFEGLEHCEDGDALIANFADSLRHRKGKLIISVPVNELAITGGEQNPFHKVNYDYEMFSELLERYFERVLYFGVDESGNVSGVSYAMSNIIAVCQGVK